MRETDRDTQLRLAAFVQGRWLTAVHDPLTGKDLQAGFLFEGARSPLVNPQRGIFKPKQMRFLLSIKTVFPRPGSKIWYDDQHEVHRQIFASDETVEYAFMGRDPEAADNRWLRAAYEHRIPTIYFLGIAPGRYQALLPAFISGWDATALKARVAFGVSDQETLSRPENAPERRYALRLAICRIAPAWRSLTRPRMSRRALFVKRAGISQTVRSHRHKHDVWSWGRAVASFEKRHE